MNLVYDRTMTNPADTRGVIKYINLNEIFAATPSGVDAALEERIGTNPLRVIAREVYGAVPTDLVIDRDDALLVLSSENNRKLLREGRVIFAIGN
jgi:hypothetical protein